MKLDNSKTREYLAKAFLLFAVILALLSVTRLASLTASVADLDKTAQAPSPAQTDASQLEKHLAYNKEKADALKKKNMVLPPTPKPSAPTCAGILGDQALINGKWYNVGETAAEAKILAIAAKHVKIEWQGKEMDLEPIKAVSAAPADAPAADNGRKKPKVRELLRANRRRGRRAEPVAETPAPAENDELAWLGEMSAELRENFLKMWNNMTDEQKQKAKERWNNMTDEQKQQAKDAWAQRL